MTSHDRRLHAFRPDLADARLRGAVEAQRFSEGQPARIVAAVADLRRAPSLEAALDTQLLCGTPVTVFDAADGFAWVQSARDSYVGYVAEADLDAAAPFPTHRVVAPRTFVYPEPDLKLPRRDVLSMGCEVAVVGHVEQRGTLYAQIVSGEAIVATHLVPIDVEAPDYVAVAERLIDTPYLWGGASAFGIDCSGLVQLAMRMAGKNVLRDSDMQAGTVGGPIDLGPGWSGLRRGDLVFWKGHVGLMTSSTELLHANGHTMSVASEPLIAAAERIGYLYGQPTGFRRP